MKDFKDLEMWKRSHRLTYEIYKTTQCFPKEELFGFNITNTPCGIIYTHKYSGGMWATY